MAFPDEKRGQVETSRPEPEDIFSAGEGRTVRTVEREQQREERERSEPPREASEREIGRLTQAPSTPVPAQVVQPVAPKSAIVEEIEQILSDGLEDIYMEMPPEVQIAFQKKGEETATQIAVLLQEVKVRVSKVLMLIREWLKIIPGVNKFFLEQEAKIKADRLLALRAKQRL
ncbi:MAG: hypothetical protein A2898_02520 [Candidatus Kerfeldbacteria bacterium RIFCSPLOWO2_01_FULL_48_11]|uniref:Uncharacterized protein n=1 Tax=Candidatus Kerfeldbacteria bacterium RIFCSPLOWO2_01_FULL_48_11 TaxID=1798543 RepID=A0A1G2B339_9BACT|nr:MAG: hypothetical protein UY34_C0012G0008 [Parcubacteria group bacterium GW2011_GWA2_48_9]KKW14745.1 MAG: hypothetical protein UY52_C0022G0024 [Parcubacteria group bacterium GW2011_GWC2_49_9]OGY83126.1 MAG: hypothetical protein A2898_02520 [Candidatus Kerfeldbacteria bacterium RIFCSPLOWO2_01_FULL_48_11]HCJ52236.1 hypothetical protein [Candidatus Kerfeldbacteria bacterium]HCM67851.1 hypothetical protein [Candidatus Kerfeldbacteria bacterium]